MRRPLYILILERDPSIRECYRSVLAPFGARVQFDLCSNSEKWKVRLAERQLSSASACPTLLLTDSDIDVLTYIKESPKWGLLPVVMVSSTPESCLPEAYDKSVSALVPCPEDPSEREDILARLVRFWLASTIPNTGG